MRTNLRAGRIVVLHLTFNQEQAWVRFPPGPFMKKNITPNLLPNRDPARIAGIMQLLQEAWERNPDLRLCQVLSHMTVGCENFYSFEDSDLELKLKQLKEQCKRIK